MQIVIEHLEPCINRWLFKEYEFVSNLFEGRVIFTNVKSDRDAQLLKPLGKVYRESATVLLSNNTNVVVLDPAAEEPLTTSDLHNSEYVVIGGIMGSHPPAGRTKKLITSKLLLAKARNIGRHQYTIAGAAYVVKLVENGKRLEEIKYVFGLKISKKLAHDMELEIELPYAFPIDDSGNIVLPKDYIDIVAEFSPVYEARVLAGDNNVCKYEDDEIH